MAFPFGIFRLLRNKQQLKRIRLISTNVVPEFQRMGIGLALMYGLVPKALDWGMEEAEFSWVMESNLLSRGSLEKGGAKITKTYRLYDWENQAPEKKAPAHVQTTAVCRHTATTADGPLEIREVRSRRELDQFAKVEIALSGEAFGIPATVKQVTRTVNGYVVGAEFAAD